MMVKTSTQEYSTLLYSCIVLYYHIQIIRIMYCVRGMGFISEEKTDRCMYDSISENGTESIISMPELEEQIVCES